MKTSPEQRKQEMYDLITRWHLSGQTQQAFCKQEQVSYHTFKYYSTQKNKECNQTPTAPKFMPVAVASVKRPQTLKISYPTGVIIDVDETISSNLLRTLIHLY